MEIVMSTMRDVINYVGGWFQRGIEISMVACLTIMTVLVFGNVVLRYVFNSGIGISEEVSRYLFVWLTFLGAVIGMHERTHLGMESLVQRLPVLGKKICFFVCQVGMLGCCWLLLEGSWQQTIVNMDNLAPVSGIPLSYIYGIGVFTSVGIGLILINNIFNFVSGKIPDDHLVQIRESQENTEEVVESLIQNTEKR